MEGIVDGFRTDGATGVEMAESLVAFGCYVGEILTRYAGGAWQHTPGAARGVPLTVRLPGARECDPIEWVFRRLEAGAAVSIRQLYTEALPSGPSGGEAPPEKLCQNRQSVTLWSRGSRI
ncbi:hypothetical protein, partial [Streptomyces kunmingensis]|uniref:hypothetical protein n=1 Tax=Streptomyces kunmingensis TaxID=68225 RepID=UPI0031D2530A